MKSPIFLLGALILVLAVAGKIAAGWFWVGLGIAFWPLFVLAIMIATMLSIGGFIIAINAIDHVQHKRRHDKNMAILRARRAS